MWLFTVALQTFFGSRAFCPPFSFEYRTGIFFLSAVFVIFLPVKGATWINFTYFCVCNLSDLDDTFCMDRFPFQPCSSWVITLWKLFTTEWLSGQFPIRGLCKPAVAPVACQIQPLGTSRPTWVLSDWAFQQRLDSRRFKGNIYKMTWNSIRVSCCVGKALSKGNTFFFSWKPHNTNRPVRQMFSSRFPWTPNQYHGRSF